jgi:asparagine synthase (glutamine-hydrolysing)
MCGIAGIIKKNGGRVRRERLADMIKTLRHRGPDAREVFAMDGTGLAHARLSIIDLAGGRQPMSIDDGRIWITFNGEIFNYVELREELIAKGCTFATRSDTEVILHLYKQEGEACVQRLNGQWAFAIWDSLRNKLFLSRDRLGIRPLFYTETKDSFLFASEIKALFACPEVERELDLHALDEIFTFWVTLPQRTAFKNIRQLQPGHSLVIENGTVRVSEYWRLEYAPENEKGEDNVKRRSEELLALLQDATRIRLRSDVPVGAYLSGGLDSTFITALTKSLVGDRLRTFSISFDDPEFDEGAYQKEASSSLHTDHSETRCTYEDIGRIFPEVVWHTEQPILRTAPAPLFLLAKLVRSSGFKVVLTGEGADETLGGYDIFKEVKIREFWARRPDSQIRPLLLKRLYPYMDGIQKQPSAYLRRFFHVSPQSLTSPFFSHLPRWDLTAKLKTFLSNEARAENASYHPLRELLQSLPRSYGSWSSFTRAEYLEARLLLPGYILSSQGDRMAMAHGIEGRHPFLDYRVAEFAAALPSRLKMKVLDQKYLLKQVGSGVVPESIRKRFKQPYRAPDGKSFFTNTWNYVEEALSASNIARDGIFDPVAVQSLVAKFRSRRPSSVKDGMALVGILSTQILLDQFIHRREFTGSSVQREHIGNQS